MNNSQLEDIKKAIQKLPSNDFHRLLVWLADYEQEKWDAEIEGDLKAGRLDGLISSALKDIEAGEYKDI
jgi:hypothetical protein